eukprot:4936798-Pyramimonas_sp.AAC.1
MGPDQDRLVFGRLRGSRTRLNLMPAALRQPERPCAGVDKGLAAAPECCASLESVEKDLSLLSLPSRHRLGGAWALDLGPTSAAKWIPGCLDMGQRRCTTSAAAWSSVLIARFLFGA